MVIAVSILSIVVGQKLGESVTKNGVYDYPLITISLGGFFIFGFFSFWIIDKLGNDYVCISKLLWSAIRTADWFCNVLDPVLF